MRDIACVQDERRRSVTNFRYRGGQRPDRIWIGVFAKANMAVADLNKMKVVADLGSDSGTDEANGSRDASIQRPHNAGARPCPTLEHLSAGECGVGRFVSASVIATIVVH